MFVFLMSGCFCYFGFCARSRREVMIRLQGGLRIGRQSAFSSQPVVEFLFFGFGDFGLFVGGCIPTF